MYIPIIKIRNEYAMGNLAFIRLIKYSFNLKSDKKINKTKQKYPKEVIILYLFF